MDTRKFLDLFERGKTGKKVDKSDWDMDYIIDNVMDLVEEYEFDWDKELLIPEDDALFADMFKAARELLIRTGIYNMTTGRIMQLSPEEIDALVNHFKAETREYVLKLAQDNGYAEKDPTADVEGHDACRKICILAALCFGKHVYPDAVYTPLFTHERSAV